MTKEQLPAYISHTVLVNGGSYIDFIKQLQARFPKIHIKFIKKVQVHYYVMQLEDHSDEVITKDAIYSLPLLALREEFSQFLFFKNIKNYNTVLKRMCNAGNNKNACYDLVQHMLTPYEKSMMINLKEAPSLTVSGLTDNNEPYTIYYNRKNLATGADVLYNLFRCPLATVNSKEFNFAEIIKKHKWVVGIH